MDEIITTVAKSRAKNAQHVLFAKDALKAIPEAVATTYGFAKQRSAFAEAVADEVAYFKPEKGYLDTASLEVGDRGRDTRYYFYKGLSEVYRDFCPDADKQLAGKTLAFAFQEAGDVAEADYASETSLLADLAEKLQTEPYASALAKLGIENAPADIAAANDAFHEIYQQRTLVERDRALSSDMKTLRATTDQTYDALVKAINALYLANELATNDEATRTALTQVIGDLNAVIVRFRKVIGSSSSKDEEKEPDTETPGTETPDTENPDGQGGEQTQTTPTEPGGDETEQPQPGVDNDGDGSPEVV